MLCISTCKGGHYLFAYRYPQSCWYTLATGSIICIRWGVYKSILYSKYQVILLQIFWHCLEKHLVQLQQQFTVTCVFPGSGLFVTPKDYSLPGFSVHGVFQEEYWRELPFPPPGDLPRSGIKRFVRQILYNWATWEATRLKKKAWVCA